MGARVGVFDSGVGGLSVWREIRRQHPDLETIYLADQAHIPYGAHSSAQVLRFATGITRYLLGRGCDAIVVACNTASAAALTTLRSEFPDALFVGMEPAVKPAAAISQSKIVGVLGTPATLAGELFLGTIERHAADVEVVRQPCPGLVDRIESGALDGPETEAMLRGFLRTPLAAGADVLVLACTHYPLLQRTIEELAGPGVHVIDPAPAVARQLGRCIEGLGSASAPGAAAEVEQPESVRTPGGRHEFRTTGDVQRFERVAGAILGRPVMASGAHWENDDLVGEPASVQSPIRER